MTLSTRVVVIAIVALTPLPAWAQAAIVHVPGTTTRDIAFTSHDGYPMLERLTMPDTAGPHPVMMLVQTAEAATMDGELRNALWSSATSTASTMASARSSINTGSPSTGYAAIVDYMKQFTRP